MPTCRAPLLVLVFALSARAGDVKPPKGFTPLFNGKDLTGWHGRAHLDPAKFDRMIEAERKAQIEKWTADAKKHWRVEKGDLINDGKGTLLTTDREFGDFELLVETKADEVILFRGSPLWLLSNSNAPWNRFRILQVGERTTIYRNEKLFLNHTRQENGWDGKVPLRRTGTIQLPLCDAARWRNIFIREIPSTEANQVLRKQGSDGFKNVFNGKDFTGWGGAVDNYEVKEEAIVCKPKKGGNVFTKEQFTDFVARVEYRLPPAGNNGLAIRYPGKGQASVDAMCEVQILDDEAPVYRKLDPRQYNGSVYGMVAAHRGYLRPTGEWNFMEVTVRGPAIVVELNGTRIVDADVSKVTEFMGKKPHPGKDRLSGHFGFCGHNDPVAFRNIQIKPLTPVKP